MLDAYTKVTGGLAKWLLLIILEFIGPAVRIVGGLLSIGGLFAFLVCLFLWGVSETPRPDIKTVTFVMLGAGLLGAALLVSYEILAYRMLIDRIDDRGEADEDESASWWNWLGVVALLAVFSVASYSYHHLRNELEALAVGLAWFLGVGIFLSIVRWCYRMGGSALKIALLNGIMRARAALAGRNKGKSDEERVVVPFRRR